MTSNRDCVERRVEAKLQTRFKKPWHAQQKTPWRANNDEEGSTHSRRIAQATPHGAPFVSFDLEIARRARHAASQEMHTHLVDITR